MLLGPVRRENLKIIKLHCDDIVRQKAKCPTTIKKVISWALYDWGNSAFATTVMAGFFPIFFKQYWSTGSPAVESTFRLSAANSIAGLIKVVTAPILGAIADKGSAKK